MKSPSRVLINQFHGSIFPVVCQCRDSRVHYRKPTLHVPPTLVRCAKYQINTSFITSPSNWATLSRRNMSQASVETSTADAGKNSRCDCIKRLASGWKMSWTLCARWLPQPAYVHCEESFQLLIHRWDAFAEISRFVCSLIFSALDLISYRTHWQVFLSSAQILSFTKLLNFTAKSQRTHPEFQEISLFPFWFRVESFLFYRHFMMRKTRARHLLVRRTKRKWLSVHSTTMKNTSHTNAVETKLEWASRLCADVVDVWKNLP